MRLKPRGKKSGSTKSRYPTGKPGSYKAARSQKTGSASRMDTEMNSSVRKVLTSDHDLDGIRGAVVQLDITGNGTDGWPPELTIPDGLTPVSGSEGSTYDVVINISMDGVLTNASVYPKGGFKFSGNPDAFDPRHGVHQVFMLVEPLVIKAKNEKSSMDELRTLSDETLSMITACGMLKGPWHGSQKSLYRSVRLFSQLLNLYADD